MKLILAYIKQNKLAEVTLQLHRIEGLPGLTVSDARGFGLPRRGHDTEARLEEVQDFVPCVRLEIICPDELAPTVVTTIKQAAHTGLRGDGGIFVLPVEHAVRIASAP